MKVTLDGIKAKIKGETYTVLPDKKTTVCQLIMENGFTINGQSACVDIANFNVDLGRKYAFEDALRNTWQLEGYLLAEQIFRTQPVKKTYSWSDVANYSLQAEYISGSTQFVVVMRDGCRFSGFINQDLGKKIPAEQLIINNVNKQVEEGTNQ